MMVLVSYDVRTADSTGPRRLRRVARACKDFGQRVQYSVFEIDVDPAQWAALKNRLEKEIDQTKDSLRYYFLGANWRLVSSTSDRSDSRPRRAARRLGECEP